MDTNAFRGGIPALMTPCNKDRAPDFDSLVEKAKELIETGMNSVVYCGSMGTGLFSRTNNVKKELLAYAKLTYL